MTIQVMYFWLLKENVSLETSLVLSLIVCGTSLQTGLALSLMVYI